jgi:hypothetical protein
MNDLFRFLLLRPANVVAEGEVNVVTPTFVDRGATQPIALAAAEAFTRDGKVLRSGEGLAYAQAARAVTAAARSGLIAAADLDAVLVQQTGKGAAAIVADGAFADEASRLKDSLAAMKLQSSSLGGDAPGLVQIIQGYDAIRGAADGQDPVRIRVLALVDFKPPLREPSPPSPPTSGGQPPKPSHTAHSQVAKIDEAIKALSAVPASGFHGALAKPVARPPVASAAIPLATDRHGAASPRPMPKHIEESPVTQAWLLSTETFGGLAPGVIKTAQDVGMDLKSHSLPTVLNALNARRVDLVTGIDLADLPQPVRAFPVGGGFDFGSGEISPDPAAPYVGPPRGPFPADVHGKLRPVGVGDLLLVKEHTLRYEGGELAHVENVLRSETLLRETRRLDRTETTVLLEQETTKEEQRDTQTTDRFSLKRETSDTINSEFSLKAGVAVDAKYGPTVEVKANSEVATSTSSESSTRQASEFSKDVVARSVSRLVERVLERRTTTTISEFEEKYSHGFDNASPDAENISGFYQWIDKVVQAQIYNYGKRLLFDITTPEPGTHFIVAQTLLADQGQLLEKPPRFTLLANQITESNYTGWAALYEVTGLEPPPAPVRTVTKAYDATMGQSPHESTKSDTLSIDDGYRAKYALVQRDMAYYEGGAFRVLVGSNWYDAFGHTSYLTMAGEVGSVAIAYDAYQIELMALTIEIFCERTERAYKAWQLKTHAAITQGYLAKRQAYDSALAQAKAAAGVVIAGRNPRFNAQIVASELRKQCITQLTAQHFDGFGALELSAQGFAQPNLNRVEEQMPYVRFFEQAFEWEHMTYIYYPYFWGLKDAWLKHMLLDDVDPKFAEFLRAGAARVVFPVRPGFEAAVIHFLETGKVWNGGPPPDITGSLYVPIVVEVQEATGAPGAERPVGEPWTYTLPTTLVQLRPNNDLPAWEKVGEVWQPSN